MRIRFLKVSIVLILIGTAIYFALNIIMSSLIHSRKEIAVPDITGKNIYDAVEKLSKCGFSLKMNGEENDQNVPAGTILRQNPPAGMLVREGRVIKVTISRGGEIVYVPDLVGQSIRSADISLRTSTLVMGEVSRRYSVVFNKDIIVSQDIAAGTKVDKDSVVNLVVSKGLPPEGTVLMPDFVNKKLQDAVDWSSRVGISLNIIKEKAAGTWKKGVVIKQYPDPDTDVTGFKDVDITFFET
ncbi:MAG: PASTA domain-containing protein [Endomicrobium sp.]|nr:PASTA domain-containing protein [Endomicrobium sp.]